MFVYIGIQYLFYKGFKEIKMFKILKFCTITILFILNTAHADSAKIKDIEKIKKAIVTINSRVPVSAYQNTGSWSGTGFIG